MPCSRFFEFFAGQFHASKTKGLGLEWFKGPLDISENTWKPWIHDAGALHISTDDDGHIIGPARIGDLGAVPLFQGARCWGFSGRWRPIICRRRSWPSENRR